MKTTIVWLVVGASLISNAVLAMLYFTKDDAPSAATNTTAQQEIVAGETTDEFNAEAEPIEQVPDDDDRTTYDAIASDFSLNIKPEYQVIVEKDGGDDSLRSTIIKIGRKGADDNGAVSLRSDDYVKIEAYPSNINGTRDQFVTNDTALQGNIADETSSQVDGIQARKFKLNGVGETIKYYFEREGITYHIEAWDVASGDTMVMLNNVVEGFSFN